MPKDTKSLSHTTWDCKYHLVFAPKYRRKIIYGDLKVEIGKPELLVQRLLRRHGREKCKKDTRIYTESAERGSDTRPDEHEGTHRPAYG